MHASRAADVDPAAPACGLVLIRRRDARRLHNQAELVTWFARHYRGATLQSVAFEAKSPAEQVSGRRMAPTTVGDHHMFVP